MLKVNHIDVFYGDVQVLWDVSFEVQEKEILVLIGANGCREIDHPSNHIRTSPAFKGSIELKGTRLDRIPDYKIVEYRYCPRPGRPSLISGNDRGGKSDYRIIDSQGQNQTPGDLKGNLSDLPAIGRTPQTIRPDLSGGEQQMCAIGRGLMSLPKLLMFDEPSLGSRPFWCRRFSIRSSESIEKGPPFYWSSKTSGKP